MGLENKRVILDGKKFKKIVDLDKKGKVGLKNGQITTEELKNIEPGSSFLVNGKRYFILTCDLHDYIMEAFQRRTQIVYPKEAGYILFKLDIGPGRRVGEAGMGSGALTSVFSRAVGEQGRVYTYEERSEFIETAQKNLAATQACDNVIIHNQPVQQGVKEKNLDAFFLDLKQPWEVLDAVTQALRPAGHLGLILPTANQVSTTLRTLEVLGYYIAEVVEVLRRGYKVNSERFRPEDVMIGHTGYLIFARRLNKRRRPQEGYRD